MKKLLKLLKLYSIGIFGICIMNSANADNNDVCNYGTIQPISVVINNTQGAMGQIMVYGVDVYPKTCASPADITDNTYNYKVLGCNNYEGLIEFINPKTNYGLITVTRKFPVNTYCDISFDYYSTKVIRYMVRIYIMNPV